MDITFGKQKPNNQQNSSKSIPNPQQKQGFFGNNQKPPSINPNDKRFDEEISNITKRLKLLEGGVSNLRSSLENLEKNTIDQQKENRRDIKTLEDENTDLKETIRSIKNTLKKIANDMGNVARDTDVQVIKKYLDLWNPVKFATPELVKKIVRDEIDTAHTRKIDSRMESIQRDIYQKQDLKNQINKEQ